MSKQTNVVPFPLTVKGFRSAADKACSPTSYEFTEEELAALCRWFSAMKYAFPGTEGVMMVNHQEAYSAVGLYNRAGGARIASLPNIRWAALRDFSGRPNSTHPVR